MQFQIKCHSFRNDFFCVNSIENKFWIHFTFWHLAKTNGHHSEINRHKHEIKMENKRKIAHGMVCMFAAAAADVDVSL